MKTLADLDLPRLAMDEPGFREDPFSYFNEARERHPWLATSKFGLVITDLIAMRDLLGRDGSLRPPYEGIVKTLGLENTPWGRFTAEQMISLPKEQHRRLRDTFALKFTPRNANLMRPVMHATISRMLDEWVPKKQMDFEEFASRFPISVMFALIGAPHDGVELLRDDLEAIGLAHSMELERFPRIQEGMVRLESFVERIIAERRANPHAQEEDLLDLLIVAADVGNIAHRVLADLLIFFFIAGYDTSKNVLTYTMYTLTGYPDLYRRCAEDLNYCRKVIEEGLRWFSPATIARYVEKDIVYRDTLLPKDQMLFFPLSVSGRDAGSFPDGERFDPDRPIEPSRRHIAFALGKHMCLGQHIARAQLQEALHRIAQRVQDPKLIGNVGWRPFYGAWGLKGLPISFTPAPARATASAS